MSDRARPSYPRLGATPWWTIRKRFQQAVPSTVSPGYLAAIFNCKEASASNNYLRPLKALGIVDDENKATELGIRWRDDNEYSAVLEEIRNATYPAELRESQPCPDPNLSAVKAWFLRTTGQGNAATEQMAALYGFLCNSSTEEQTRVAVTPRQSKNGAKSSPTSKGSTRRQPDTDNSAREDQGKAVHMGASDGQSSTQGRVAPRSSPALHIDIQVHISSEASADQIDQVFKSMATHLYGKE